MAVLLKHKADPNKGIPSEIVMPKIHVRTRCLFTAFRRLSLALPLPFLGLPPPFLDLPLPFLGPFAAFP